MKVESTSVFNTLVIGHQSDEYFAAVHMETSNNYFHFSHFNSTDGTILWGTSYQYLAYVTISYSLDDLYLYIGGSNTLQGGKAFLVKQQIGSTSTSLELLLPGSGTGS